jgi:hypothetical protein
MFLTGPASWSSTLLNDLYSCGIVFTMHALEVRPAPWARFRQLRMCSLRWRLDHLAPDRRATCPPRRAGARGPSPAACKWPDKLAAGRWSRRLSSAPGPADPGRAPYVVSWAPRRLLLGAVSAPAAGPARHDLPRNVTTAPGGCAWAQPGPSRSPPAGCPDDSLRGSGGLPGLAPAALG